MSNPLSIAASVAGIVSLSAAVFQQVSKFVKKAKGAESNVKELANQTRNLSGVLHNLALLASALEDQDSAATFKAHQLYACSQTLFEIEKRLKKAEYAFQTGSKTRNALRSLKWPFSVDETKSLISDMAAHRGTLELALSADTLERVVHILQSQEKIQKSVELVSRKLDRMSAVQTRVTMDSRRKEVFQYFLKVNPQPKFQIALRLRQVFTGLWLTQRDPTFQTWRNTHHSCLWLHGIPGAGKTVLCGVVIEEILQQSTATTAVAFHFCSYGVKDSQNVVSILCSIAAQLTQQNEAAFDLLDDFFTLLQPDGGLPSDPDVNLIRGLINKLCSLYERVFLVINGLDECGEVIGQVAKELRLVFDSCPSMSIGVFSRNEQEIHEELAEAFVMIEITARSEDIEIFVHAEMGKRRQLKRIGLQNPSLAVDIREKLVNGAHGM